MKTDLVVRRAEPSDLPALGRLGAELSRIHSAFDRERFIAPGSNPEETYARFLGSQLSREDVAIFVAVRHRSVVGYVYAGIEPASLKELRDEAGFIHDVVVDENVRGTGIGDSLLNVAIDWLVSRQLRHVMLWTAAQNEAGQRLFERLGFRRTMIEMTREL
jgi:ribosomal protein S18 acetylase RimI-like enzyme